MTESDEDKEIIVRAIKQAKSMKKQLARDMVDHLPEEKNVVSVFMAGSTGAGKTETARSIIAQFWQEHNLQVVHI